MRCLCMTMLSGGAGFWVGSQYQVPEWLQWVLLSLEPRRGFLPSWRNGGRQKWGVIVLSALSCGKAWTRGWLELIAAWLLSWRFIAAAPVVGCYRSKREHARFSMKKRKRESEAEMIARFQEEARLVLAKRRDASVRWLDIAAATDRDMEPVGRLAGSTLQKRISPHDLDGP